MIERTTENWTLQTPRRESRWRIWWQGGGCFFEWQVPAGISIRGGIVWLLLATLAVPGCGDGRPKRVPISGKVLIDGQPMEYGIVQIMPTGNRAATGTISEDGTFTLGCFERDDGCVLGTHAVRVDGSKPIGLTKVQWYAPKRFANPATAQLEVTIDEPTEDLVIELNTGGSRPFKPFIEVLARGMSDDDIRKADTPF